MAWTSELGRQVNQKNRLQDHAGFLTTSLFQKIGNVTFLISLRRERPHVVNFILDVDEKIQEAVAERLAKLGSVDSLFTLKIWKNVVLIPSFTNAASLEDILNVRDEWPFIPEHSEMLADDIISGLSALHEVGLQRNRFSEGDILLVGRENKYYFQIAGLQHCTCIDDQKPNSLEPMNQEELESFKKVMQYVGKRPESQKFTSKLVSRLGIRPLKDLHSGIQDDFNRRRELEIYLHAVHIFSTTFGGVRKG